MESIVHKGNLDDTLPIHRLRWFQPDEKENIYRKLHITQMYCKRQIHNQRLIYCHFFYFNDDCVPFTHIV